MTREELRRENARKLASGKGGKADFARVVSMEPSQVSQLIGPNPSKNIGNSIARRIEQAYKLPEGWLDVEHSETRMPGDDDDEEVGPNASAEYARDESVVAPVRDNDGFISGDGTLGADVLGVRIGGALETIPIRAVKLRLQAGVNGYVAEPDLDTDHGIFQVPKYVIDKLGLNPADLMIMTVEGRSMEPMYFEDDKVLVDTSKRVPKNNECFAVNWNGESIIKCLIRKANDWCLYSFNSKFPSMSVRSGQCSIIGQVVWQPDRIVVGRL